MTEFSGRTVAEAVETGLHTLGLAEEEVEVQVLDEGRGGVFGLGSRVARVRLTPRQSQASAETASSAAPSSLPAAPAEIAAEPTPTAQPAAATEPAPQNPPPAPAPAAEADEELLRVCQDFLQTMLRHMDFRATVEASIKDPEGEDEEPTYYLNIAGEDLGGLIGRRGETLDAIQYLVRLIANRHTHNWLRVEVDVEGYKERRTRGLHRMALSMAERAVREKRTIVLEAMPARERRLVHLALRDRDDVVTRSIGEGENRKVTIVPN